MCEVALSGTRYRWDVKRLMFIRTGALALSKDERSRPGYSFHCRSNTPSFVIALSLIAAQAIVSTYLDGRTLSPDLYSIIVFEVRTRLIDGKVPVLDQALCDTIEDATMEFERHYWDRA